MNKIHTIPINCLNSYQNNTYPALGDTKTTDKTPGYLRY